MIIRHEVGDFWGPGGDDGTWHRFVGQPSRMGATAICGAAWDRHLSASSVPPGQPICARCQPAIQGSNRVVVGLDLGQASDYSALVLLEVHPGHEGAVQRYSVGFIHRWQLGSSYVTIAHDAARLVQGLGERGRLVVDATGVGAGVVDMLRAARLAPVAVTLTSGREASAVAGGWHVPKLEVAAGLVRVFQEQRIAIRKDLGLAGVLLGEARSFKIKPTLHGAVTVEAWRERDHDDLVLSLGLAVWWAEQHSGLILPEMGQPVPLSGAWDPSRAAEAWWLSPVPDIDAELPPKDRPANQADNAETPTWLARLRGWW